MKEALFLKLDNESAWFTPPAVDEDGEINPDDNPIYDETLTAAYFNRSGESEVLHGTAEALLDWLEENRGDFYDLPTTVLLSGVNLVAMKVNIPSKQAKHVAQALPFMLEDLVAEDIETLHIAMGARHKDGDLPVVLCQKRYIEQLTAHLTNIGLPPKEVLADMDCLPAEEGVWHFLTNGRDLMVRVGTQDALTIELDALPVLLNSLFVEDIDPPEAIKVVVSNDQVSENLENWLKTQFTSHLVDVEAEFDIEHCDQTSFLYLCEATQGNQSQGIINLLQGDFKPTSERRPSLIKWKPMAVLASIFVIFFVGFQYTQAWKIDTRTAQVDQEAKALYKKYFPRDKNVTDIKRRMKKKLEAAQKTGGGQGFLTLLTLVGEKLNEMNRGAGSPRLSPIRMMFDQNQGDLKIDFIAGGYGDLDDLKARLEAQSLTVEIARASQDGDKLKARVNIRSAS